MKKLIKLDPVSKRYTEVDAVKLERTSNELLEYINKNVSPQDDPYGIWTWVVPLCEGVLSNTQALPLAYANLPLKYPLREGLLSDEFEKIYAPFSNTITGTPLEKTDNLVINGELYTYVDFED